MSVDPVVTDASTGSSFNRYAYANNSPYKYLDVDGRQAALALCATPPSCVVGVVLTIGTIYYADKAISGTKQALQSSSSPTKNEAADTPKSEDKKGADAPRGEGKDNQPKSDLPRDPSGNYLPHPDAEGPHSTLGTRPSSTGGTYTQGATFDGNGKFEGRTDVTDHGRPQNHTNPHKHPATGPNSVGKPKPIKE